MELAMFFRLKELSKKRKISQLKLALDLRASLKTPVAHTHVTNICYNKGNQAKEQKRWGTEGYLTKIFDLQS